MDQANNGRPALWTRVALLEKAMAEREAEAANLRARVVHLEAQVLEPKEATCDD